jgi:O-antigen ligase
VFLFVYALMQRQRSSRVILRILWSTIVVADVNALAGIWQGRQGDDTTGLFEALGHKNALASTVLLPLFVSIGVATTRRNMGSKALAYGSTGAMVLMLWYAGSRGAVVAFLCGLAAYAFIARIRLQIIAMAIAVPLILLAVYPDFGKRSGIRDHFLEATEGAEAGNLEWRLTQRWPYFFKRALDHPWLGVGTDVDLSLGKEGNTPHNGYLALAIISGLPALGLVLFFLIVTLKRSAALGYRGSTASDRGIGTGVFAATVSLAVHNLVDFTFGIGATAYLFWMSCALVTSLTTGDMNVTRPRRHPVSPSTPLANGQAGGGGLLRHSRPRGVARVRLVRAADGHTLPCQIQSRHDRG